MSAVQAESITEASQEVATAGMPASEYNPPTRIKAVCAESLHVRASPMGEVRGYLYRGQIVEVFESEEGWSQIAAGEWRGLWVRDSWLCG
jgi:hypothetical protein